MSARTTHSDLATLIENLATKLSSIPQGYCVSDPSTLRLLTDGARILREQDQRIDELTVGLREHGGRAARKYLAADSLCNRSKTGWKVSRILHILVYLECEFTRLAQAKKTLHMRKFPKREQKIIVAYKGKIDAIKDSFAPIGRL